MLRAAESNPVHRQDRIDSSVSVVDASHTLFQSLDATHDGLINADDNGWHAQLDIGTEVVLNVMRLTNSEAVTQAQMTALVRSYDLNRDGRLDEGLQLRGAGDTGEGAHLLRAIFAMPERTSPAPTGEASAGYEQLKEFGNVLVDMMDASRDGMVTREDAEAYAADGVLEGAALVEAVLRLTKTDAVTPSRVVALMRSFDENGNDRLDNDARSLPQDPTGRMIRISEAQELSRALFADITE